MWLRLRPSWRRAAKSPPIFDAENIVLGAAFKDKKAAIDACADILIRRGYTDESYRKDMHQRDKEASVYIGDGVAMPHGLGTSKDSIKTSGICFIQVPGGVEFEEGTAYLLVGVAGKGEEHVDILGRLGNLFCEESNLEALRKAKTKEEVLNILDLSDLLQ